jgi:hypothetical protein
MMTHKRKADDTDGLEDAETRRDEADCGAAVFFGGVGALRDDGEDDDDHAYEG